MKKDAAQRFKAQQAAAPVTDPDSGRLASAPETDAISLTGVAKTYLSPGGSSLDVIRDLSLVVADREFCAVVGPTGCGKSTMLQLIAGLAHADSGEVRVFGKRVTGIPRDIGYMFQNDALLPWRGVVSNIAEGPLLRGVGRSEAIRQAREWADHVGLSMFERHYPHQLSGGMRKRVALARCLINKPKLLLMDEPFVALDAQTRSRIADTLLSLWTGSGSAIVFVTHDIAEAIALADRVVVMTSRPATVKGVVEIPLERPRSVEDLRADPKFADLYRRVWDLLRGEVQASTV